MLKLWCYIFLSLLILSNCQSNNNVIYSKNNDIKIAIYDEKEKEYLEKIILFKKNDAEMVYKGNFLLIKNINEDVLFYILNIIRLEMDIIAANMANVNTTRTENGGPYIRKYLKITIEDGIEIVEDNKRQSALVYDPAHPDAIKTGELKGYLRKPNVDIITEQVDMITKSRLYERIYEYAKDTYKNIIW
jgi:flagellar basal-body rod protein FlgC